MTSSLHAYRHARIVIQSARSTVAEAARAMVSNDVGCVLVSESGSLVGIVTDRDLAARVVAAGRSAAATRLGEVMSKPVAKLSVDAPLAEALRLMREGNLRRVPLVEADRVVGMVTLDDLLLAKEATLEALSDIVRSQIVEGGPARTHRFDEWTHLARKHARALGTKTKLLRRVERGTGLSRRDAEAALDAVLEALVQSLDAELGARLIERLPVAYRGHLREVLIGPATAGACRRLEARIERNLDVSHHRAAKIARSVGRALGDFVTASDPLGRRLPRDLRVLLPERAAQAAAFDSERRMGRAL